jgi:hypothetical protein
VPQDKSYARRLLERLPKFQEGGEVGFLRFPEESRGTRGPSAEQLGTIAKQTGLVGLGFAPGAGMADYLGQFPSVEGGTEPSAVENWRQGNYGTAALQGLGAMGDMMYAVPVLGATVGSAMKGPRAAQRMLKELPARPKVSEEGFYSQVEKAVLDNPQQKGTGDQFLAQIQKTPGVKPEELQYTGLDTFLAGRPSVTKAEIQDFLDTNRVQLQEVKLGSASNAQITSQSSNDIREILEAGQVFDDDAANFLERYQSARLSGRRDMQTEASLEEYLRNAGDNRTIDEITEASTGLAGQTRWHLGSRPGVQTEIPGGENYREVLLTLPTEARTPKGSIVRDNADPDYPFAVMVDGQVINRLNTDLRPEEYIQEAVEEVKKSRQYQDAFRSSHFDQPNILAHMRVNDRVVDGKPTLFVEEIQSDWHQAGRKQGYKSPSGDQRTATSAKKMEGYWEVRDQNGEFITNVIDRRQNEAGALEMANARLAEADPMNIADSKRVPDAPFKTSWHELTLKKAINEAATKGYDQIAFTTGKTQADRYDLSKQVDRISYFKTPEGQYHVVARDKTGRDVELGTNNSLEDLEGKIGKSLTEKISRGEGDFSGGDFTDLTGVDLQVGGEGMKGFYDTILPKSLDKIGKKYGTKVRKTTMDTPDGPVEVWAMDIPPEMRETISSQGQPLFQIGAGAAGLGTAGILSLTPGEAEARE